MPDVSQGGKCDKVAPSYTGDAAASTEVKYCGVSEFYAGILMSSLMLDHALAYARKGWRVFPLHGIEAGRCTCRKAHCTSPGKHPRVASGFKSASTDRTEITKWWTRWPNANIGVATGSGLCVIDLDGEEGFNQFKALIAKNEVIPDTLVSKTGNGYHIVFATRADGPEVRSTKHGKIDVKAEGGYIVAPPSIHYSGRKYQWMKANCLAVLPDWLRQWSQGYEITANRGSSLSAQPAHLAKYEQRDTSKRLSEALVTVWSPSEQARLESALHAIPSDSYETWFTVGMALQQLRWETNEGDTGFDLWDRWSQGTPDKYAPEICEEKWKTFGRSGRAGITIGSVYHLANQHGWNPAAEATAPKKMNGHHVALPAALTTRPIVWPDVTEEGWPRATMLNTKVAVIHLGVDCRKDLFHNRNLLSGHIMQQHAVSHLVDDAVIVLRDVIRERYGFDPRKENVQDALETLCRSHAFDPLLDHLASLKWDGVRRIDSWLSTYLGAAPTDFNHHAGRLVLIAAVRRARQPGTKFDQILVLEGKEGLGKSSAIAILAGESYYTDATILNLDDRGQMEKIEGVWLYELSDLSGIKRAEVEHVKAFASRSEDKARPAYGRNPETRKRRCIFIGTTNRDDYLISDTGNRRFWPVKTGRVDLDALRRDRDQLWAEAAELEARGASIVLPERLWGHAAQEQEQRRATDPWLELIHNHVEQRGVTDTTILEVLSGALQITADRVNFREEQRARTILRQLGFHRKQKREGGKHVWKYRRELAAP